MLHCLQPPYVYAIKVDGKKREKKDLTINMLRSVRMNYGVGVTV